MKFYNLPRGTVSLGMGPAAMDFDFVENHLKRESVASEANG